MKPDFSAVQRIGVFKLRNIGDVLIITPALRALREAFPKAHITVIVNSVTDAMLANNPHVDRVIVYERHAKNETLFHAIATELKYWWQIWRSKLDLAIDFTRGDRPAFSTWFSGARFRVAAYDGWSRSDWRNVIYTHVVPAPPPSHEVEQHLWILRQIGIDARDKSLCLVVPEKERAWAAEISARAHRGRLVHIHPVARWLFKCWDDEKMAAIIDWLQGAKKTAVVVTSSSDPRELERTRRILAFCRSQPIFLEGQSTLVQLAALSRQAACFFGVDTAPMHIAAAVDTPVVALFGPTYPASWGPWCERQITLRKTCACEQAARQVCDWNQVRDCLQQISVEEAKAALDHFL